MGETRESTFVTASPQKVTFVAIAYQAVFLWQINNSVFRNPLGNTPHMSSIFISYRREDGADAAQNIYDKLSIGPGVEFEKRINEVLKIDDPDDLVPWPM